MQTHLRIPESGQLSGKNLYPSTPANRGGLVGLAIDGLPIWSSLYQHSQNDTCCDAGVISSTLADNCNNLMGAGKDIISLSQAIVHAVKISLKL